MKIVICGSMAYSKDMLQIAELLEQKGHHVTTPVNSQDYADGTFTIESKWEKIDYDVFKNYYKRINEGDAVLVVNKEKHGVENYIGANTLIEMAFAHISDKPIFLLNPVPKLAYTDEIEAMNPIVINGDLEKVVSISEFQL